MQVVCINQKNFKDVTLEGIYEAVEIENDFYELVTNSGETRKYAKKYFNPIPVVPPEPVYVISIGEGRNGKIIVQARIDYRIANKQNQNYSIELNAERVAGNCGVIHIYYINSIFESFNCAGCPGLFKMVIEAIIDYYLNPGGKSAAQIVFSTNDSYEEIWTVLDEISDVTTESRRNPNSGARVKTWIFYVHDEDGIEEDDDDDDEDDE